MEQILIHEYILTWKKVCNFTRFGWKNKINWIVIGMLWNISDPYYVFL